MKEKDYKRAQEIKAEIARLDKLKNFLLLTRKDRSLDHTFIVRRFNTIDAARDAEGEFEFKIEDSDKDVFVETCARRIEVLEREFAVLGG